MTEYDQESKCRSLIFYDRGMGRKPLMRCSTSKIVKDEFEVQGVLDWTSQRHLSIIGVSLGGTMCAVM